MDLTEWYRNNENEAIRQSYARGETRGVGKGKTEGKAEAVLQVLGARGLEVSFAQREQVLGCQNGALLDRWLLQALTASSAQEALQDR